MVTGTFNDRALHRLLGSVVYADVEGWEFYQVPVYAALAFFVMLLFVAVPRDWKRRMVWKHGRRLRGPELVTTAELNEKLGKSKLMRRYKVAAGHLFVFMHTNTFNNDPFYSNGARPVSRPRRTTRAKWSLLWCA